MRENWRLYQNYIIIAILSLISVFFLPMLGSSVGIGFNVPNTGAGWIVWILTKLCVVLDNILIFDQFVKQAKVNVRDNEQFKKAEEILNSIEENNDDDIKPALFYITELYKKRGISLTITTALSIFGLTNAILTFDWVSMLTYIFTIVLALIFGWIAMNEVEDIWVNKHYKYALKIQKEKEIENVRNSEEQSNDSIEESSGAGSEEQNRHSEPLCS